MPRPPFRTSALAVLLALADTGPALACFGPDPGAASTNAGDHLGWAQSRDRAALSDNLAGKFHALDRCGGGDDQMRDVFAGL